MSAIRGQTLDHLVDLLQLSRLRLNLRLQHLLELGVVLFLRLQAHPDIIRFDDGLALHFVQIVIGLNNKTALPILESCNALLEVAVVMDGNILNLAHFLEFLAVQLLLQELFRLELDSGLKALFTIEAV